MAPRKPAAMTELIEKIRSFTTRYQVANDPYLNGLLEAAQRLERQVLRVARADADPDQPHAATSRSATAGVAAQCVCR